MIAALVLLTAISASAFAQARDPLEAGIEALEKNDLASAQASFEQATRSEPNNAKAWLLLAQTYARRKDQAQASAAAQKAEALGVEDPLILQGLANFYATVLPDPHKAADFGQRYAERAPNDKTAWQRLAAFCIATGQLDPAIQAATRSVKLSPYDEEAHFRLAQAYLLKPDFPSAISVLENARKIFDKSPQIELALGVAYYGLREFTKAVDQFLNTIRLAPDVPQPYVFLGRILDQAGDRLPLVARRFAEFEAGHPNNPLGYVLHAKALIAQLPPAGDAPEAGIALELLRKALALREDDAEAHYLMGIMLERGGDWTGAATHLERSIALNAKDPAPHYRLARVYGRLRRSADSERERAIHEKLSEEEAGTDRRGIAIGQPRPVPER
jgi:Flp pilus assembly protein TadD